jgi:hypothetical protein
MVFALIVIFGAARCGGSPSAPSSPPGGAAVDFSGLWQGTVKYTQCTRLRHCFAKVGSSESFTVRVRQSAARVRAVFTISEYAVELSGEVLPDGSLDLTGSSSFVSDTTPDFDVAIAVKQFSIKLAAGTGLAGTLVYDIRANVDNSEIAVSPDAATLGGDIVNASRRDLTMFASTLDGTWHGRFIVRSCVPFGAYCYPNRVDDISLLELQFAQNGSEVTGTAKTFGNMPITGQLSGRSLSITGETLSPASGGASSTRITAWNAAIDEFGRMSGTFEFSYAWPASAPVIGSTGRAELWQVVKMP